MRVHLDDMQRKRVEVWVWENWSLIEADRTTQEAASQMATEKLGITVTPWHVTEATKAIGKKWPALTGHRIGPRPNPKLGTRDDLAEVVAELKAANASIYALNETVQSLTRQVGELVAGVSLLVEARGRDQREEAGFLKAN